MEICCPLCETSPLGATIFIIFQHFHSQSTHTHFANNFITWQPVSTLGSGHHVMIQECEHVQRLKTARCKISPVYIKIR